MDMIHIHSHPIYTDIEVLGNGPDNFLASNGDLRFKQGHPVFGAEYQMVGLPRNRMKVVSQTVLVILLVLIVGFHEGGFGANIIPDSTGGG